MVSNVTGRYRASMIAVVVIVAIGIWPMLVAPVGRAYIAFCARFLADAPFGHHYPPLAVAFVAPIVALLTVGFLVALLRQIQGQHSLDAAVARQCDDADEGLRQIVHRLGLKGRVIVSRDRAAYAFCGGLIQPRIYLSWGLLGLLTATELEAVLWHERHHLDRRDPLRFFVADLAGSLAPFFPALGTLSNRLRIRSELAADRASLMATSVEDLASALVKVMRASQPVQNRVTIASLSPTDARIAALTGRQISVPFDRSDVVVSVGLALTALAIIAWLSVQPINLPPACSVCPPF